MRPLFRVGFAMCSSSLVVLAVACGGDKSGGGDAKSPSSSGASGDDVASGSGTSGSTGPTHPGDSTGPSGSGGGSSTTTQLGDGGDLQGAKLGGKVHTESESKGVGGPKSTGGQSAGEPGRTKQDIQTMVGVRRDDARACYDKGAAAHPGIEGDLVVNWVIDPQGNVSEAAVDTGKSSILEPSVGACVVDVIKKIHFAASAKGYETRAFYPFNFKPKTFSAKDAGK